MLSVWPSKRAQYVGSTEDEATGSTGKYGGSELTAAEEPYHSNLRDVHDDDKSRTTSTREQSIYVAEVHQAYRKSARVTKQAKNHERA